MSDGSNRLKELLDGKLSPQEIADDPMLASLAERIYGADFIEHIGISRGETKRALADQFTEIDGAAAILVDLVEAPDYLVEVYHPALIYSVLVTDVPIPRDNYF